MNINGTQLSFPSSMIYAIPTQSAFPTVITTKITTGIYSFNISLFTCLVGPSNHSLSSHISSAPYLFCPSVSLCSTSRGSLSFMSEANRRRFMGDDEKSRDSQTASGEKSTSFVPDSPQLNSTSANNRESSLPLLTRRQHENFPSKTQRSSAPPQFDMEADEHRRDGQQGKLLPVIMLNGQPAKNPLDSGLEDQANDRETDGRTASQADGQPNSQPSSTQSTQANGSPEREAPLSGQNTTAKEEEEEVSIDPKESLEPFAWDDLEERFLRKMEECQRREEDVEREFGEWCQV